MSINTPTVTKDGTGTVIKKIKKNCGSDLGNKKKSSKILDKLQGTDQ